MRSRPLLILAILVMLLGPVATAVPVDDGTVGQEAPVPAGDPIHLHLRAGTFDPLEEEAGPSWLRRGSTHPYHVLQFDGPIQKAWRDASAEAGIDLLGYLPDYAFFARIPAARLDDARGMDHVRYVGPAHLAYRVDPRLWDPHIGPIDLTITTWDGVDSAGLAQAIHQWGGTVRSVDTNMVRVRLAPSTAISLASDPALAVSWIEPYMAPEPLNDNAAKTAKARQANDGAFSNNNKSAWAYDPTTDTFNGWTGEGVNVAVADSGLDDTHPAFDGRIEAYYDYDNNGRADYNGHGTHVSGTILGDGDWRAGDSGVDGKYAGMAPEAGLVVQETLTRNARYTLTQVARDTVRGGASVSSNSWGIAYVSAYDTTCQAYDTFTRDSDSRTNGDQEVTYVFSAGNFGSYGISLPATAKNIITVGATGNDRGGLSSNTVWYASSKGPCGDGRIKPDLVMPGVYIASAGSSDTSDGQTSYVYASGTSMSCPGVAGAAAVLTQYLEEEKDMDDPSPALLKANLINGAVPLSGYNYPGNSQGWGRVDLADSMFDTSNFMIWREDQSVALDTSSGTDSHSQFYLVKSDRPLKVTLAWTDDAGVTSSSKHLINDLDLELVDPNGNTYPGNNFLGGQSSIGGSSLHDHVNNVEGFLLDIPTPGIWTVKVKAHNMPSGPQDFALVVSGNVRRGHVDLNPSALTSAPSDVEEYYTARLSATFENLGNRAVDVFDFKVEHVHPDGATTLLDDGNVTELGAGKQSMLSWDYTGARGTHTLRVTLDPEDQVPESDETNNVLEVHQFFKGFGVDVSPSAAEETTDPGEPVDFTITLRNGGNVADEFTTAITDAPEGWTAGLAANTFSLDPGGTTPVVVAVIPSRDALAGEVGGINLTATSQGNTTKTRTITLTTVVNQVFGLELNAPVDHLELLPAEEKDFTIRIHNPGNGVDRYELVLPDELGSGWWPSIPEPWLDLPHRSDGDAALRLAAPNPSPAGSSIEFQVTVRSLKSGMEGAVHLSAETLQFHKNVYQVHQYDTQGDVGDTVVVPITIDNQGNGPVEYLLGSGAPAKWEAGFPVPAWTVPGYTESQVNMTFTVPQDALAGTLNISVSAVPDGGEVLRRNLTFEVRQFHDLEMEVLSGKATITQGESFTVETRLRNLGNGVEEVKVLVHELPPFWTYDMGGMEVEVMPFSQKVMTIRMRTSKDTGGGDYQVGLLARFGHPQETVTGTAHATVLTRPDIRVLDDTLRLSAQEVVNGDQLQMSLLVENQGQTGSGDLYIQFLMDGASLGQAVFVKGLDPGESRNVTFSWIANETGMHEISAVLDSTDSVDETREDNNMVSARVNVEELDLRTSPGPGPLLVVIVLAAIAGLALWWRRHGR